MATVQMVYDAIDAAADFTLALDFDNPGLLVGDPNEQVRGVLAALDVTDSVIGEAISRGANLIVTHHPVILHAMKRYARVEIGSCRNLCNQRTYKS